MFKIKNIRTEYKINPLGLVTNHPRLCWELTADGRGVIQTAYRIICSNSSRDLDKELNLVWDSGRIESEKSVHIEYNGRPLLSGERVFWKAKSWNNKGQESDWSEPAFWEMGLLNKADWKARWIEPVIEEDTLVSGPSTYLRKDFSIDKSVLKATVYITSRGLYELSLNGQKVSTDLFTPGWTSYHKRLQYQVYDLTKQVKSGENAIGVILADGWYRGFFGWEGKKNLYGDKLALLFQLKIIYTDNTEEFISSNKDWKSITGPILKSDIYNGESYDARLEQFGWDSPGFDDQNWKLVTEKDYEYDNLVASEGVPVRITETINPVERIITPKGELVFDLGQNMVGWVKFKLKGKPGNQVVINHAEVLDRDGNFYTENLREAEAEDLYIFKGEGMEVWEPRFTFHGFRYIKISGYEGEINRDDIEARVIHSDMEATGDFECSNPLINQLQKNIQWGLRGNFLDVPTDCPQRDERLGWTGDAQVFAPTACFNRHTASFYTKWMKDFIVDQKDDGSVPWVVPNIIKDGGGTGWSDGFGATGWADAAVIIPWTVYQVYGDSRILEQQYESMKGWEEYMIKESADTYIFSSGFHFGDWLSFAEYYSYNYNAPDYGYAGAHTDKELIATAYFYYTTELMQKIASILKKKEDASRYTSIMPKIKGAFQKEFLTQTGRLTSNTQTAYVLALSFGLLPDNMVGIAAKRLADDVTYFGHLTTGFLGTPLICKALTENGYSDIAYKLLFNDRYPSWLYPVTMGATTIWERWDCIKPDGTFQTAGMNSFNHYAYGAVGDWLYTSVAGIRFDPEFPGYKRIIIKPYLTDKLDYTKARFHSLYGDILSHWERKGEELYLNIEIPVNTTAIVHLPVINIEKITENSISIRNNKDVKIIGAKGDRTLVEVGSGKYQFKIK